MDAGSWDERYAASELVWSAGPNQFVEQACADLPAGRALDLAAGEGRNALWLAGRGWRVTAVDFSRVALDKGARVEAARAAEAGERSPIPVDWQCADATTWRGEGYDLAVLAYLHLRPDLRAAAVRNAVDALAPGGMFVLVAHDASNLTEGTGGPQDPEVLYTASDVLDDLADYALEVHRAEVVDRRVGGEASGHRHEGESTAIAKDVLVLLTRR